MSLSVYTHHHVWRDEERVAALAVRVQATDPSRPVCWIGGGGAALHVGMDLETAAQLAADIMRELQRWEEGDQPAL